FFGPRVATVQSQARLAMDNGVGFQVSDARELAQVGLRLLGDRALLEEIGRKATGIIAANRGVSARYAREIADFACSYGAGG
ncbi:MAG TPA: hypothetical protein VGS41_12860, partial [Chthonomonadales bacterium]|nr:hypothetical protein [Chthonomonadales bacterium]